MDAAGEKNCGWMSGRVFGLMSGCVDVWMAGWKKNADNKRVKRLLAFF